MGILTEIILLGSLFLPFRNQSLTRQFSTGSVGVKSNVTIR
jgi:hypothetical protein